MSVLGSQFIAQLTSRGCAGVRRWSREVSKKKNGATIHRDVNSVLYIG